METNRHWEVAMGFYEFLDWLDTVVIIAPVKQGILLFALTALIVGVLSEVGRRRK